MAKTDVVMPQMGESITTGTITKWHKKVGDLIKLDETLLDISTDKVESEIPSPVAGKIVALLFPEGSTIDVGKVIAHIDDDANAVVSNAAPVTPATAPSNAEVPGSSKAETKVTEKLGTPAVASSNNNANQNDNNESGKFYTPLVKKMASEAGVNLNELKNLPGSGSAGRVNKADLEKFISSKSSSTPANNNEAPAAARTNAPASMPKQVMGSGRVDIIPMDNMRKAIARNMVESKRNIPHVNSISEVDLSHLVKFRESFKNEFEKQEGFKLTYSPFIIRALIMSLRDHPMVNASLDGEQILVKKDINLGVAVAVPGNGLVVPVIKSADTLSMIGLCRTLNDLANKARSKKLTMDDLTGGTFTFTNVGSFGTLMATPVILAPQVGIYASGVIQKRAVVTKDDAIAVRSMMYGTHTYDHRLVDGELGGKFLESVHAHLVEMKPKEMF